MKFSIIIPTYNNVDLLKKCLESVIKYTDLSDTEIIVVANGCTDGTESYLTIRKETCPQLRIFWHKEAMGYTKAVSTGFDLCDGQYIVLLNNDTELLQQNKNKWIEMLYSPFQAGAERVGITGVTKVAKPELLNRPFLIFFCVMIDIRLANRIGFLDEVFSPGYGEDADYCWRAEAKGYKVVQVPSEEPLISDGKQYVGTTFPIYHVGTQTFKDVEEYPEVVKRNTKIIEERWGKNEPEFETIKGTGEAEGITIAYDKNWKPFGDDKEFKPLGHSNSPTAYFIPNAENLSITPEGKRIPEEEFIRVPNSAFASNKDAYGFPVSDNTAYFSEAPSIKYGNPDCLNVERAKQIDGWTLETELLELAKMAVNAKVFIEIGSWHGRSSRAIADNLPEGGKLYCIDTWNGSDGEENYHKEAKKWKGDSVYHSFLYNNLDLIQAGKIIPLRAHSDTTCVFYTSLIHNGKMPKADVIFIDGGHTYESVKDDLSWVSALTKDGIICGHDYIYDHPGVIKAVDERFGKENIQILPSTSIWKLNNRELQEYFRKGAGNLHSALSWKELDDMNKNVPEGGKRFYMQDLPIKEQELAKPKEYSQEWFKNGNRVNEPIIIETQEPVTIGNEPEELKVTVGIPTKDRYGALGHCLQSIIFQTYTPHEIIVVDDSHPATDIRTIPVLNYLMQTAEEKGIKFRVIFGEKKGQHFSHQAIQEEAAGNWIFRIDDDCTADPHCLEDLLGTIDNWTEYEDEVKIGAVAPVVLLPFSKEWENSMPQNAITKADTNAQWFKRTELVDSRYNATQDHLYSCFIYKKGIANYEQSLSPVAHREETIFTYAIKRAGYKLKINPTAVVHHFRSETGGIRSHADIQKMVQDDEGTFLCRLSLWDAIPDKQKIVVLNNGIGDHWAFKHILIEMLSKYPLIKIACCYPDVFFDVDKSCVEIISISDAENMFNGNIQAFSIYHKMSEWNWKGTLEDAFRKLYLNS